MTTPATMKPSANNKFPEVEEDDESISIRDDCVIWGMLIDFVPDVTGVSLSESTGFLKTPGGAPANVACAITKLGGSSAFIGKENLMST
ncbi:Carbohydrate kinase PfkB [Macleaya cordata]|uniref:Carbohydrate kinase PfkB n=1 Tax=Macleaya cordata TaxID=56857 RepID=A0A200PP74_MACCD|nr:Carbohydrate kinase PfkB [Macleaya cordata]